VRGKSPGGGTSPRRTKRGGAKFKIKKLKFKIVIFL